jgi:hypothetical protein
LSILLKFLLVPLLLVILLSGFTSNENKAYLKSYSTPNSTILPTQSANAKELKKYDKITLNKETDHFLLYCNEKDKELLKDLSEALESGYKKVTKDLKCKLNRKVVVNIYPDTKTFHKAIGKPDAPEWYVGEGSGYMISIASNMSQASPTNVVVHELTHVITNTNFKVLPEWLFQGIAMYEGKETPLSRIKSTVHLGVISRCIPTLKDLDISYWRFVDKGGYEYSYAAVDFIIKEFGYDKLNKFIRSPNDYKKSFGLTEDKLNEKWFLYIMKNYN